MAIGDTIFQWMGFTRYNATPPTTATQGVQELQSDEHGNLKVTVADAGSLSALSSCKQITVADGTDLVGGVTSGIRTNTSGLVKMTFEDDATPVTLYLLQGKTYAYRVKRVWSTGTDAGLQTAGVLHALY